MWAAEYFSAGAGRRLQRQELQGAASKGVGRGRDPVGGRSGDPVRKIEAALVIPRVTSVAVDGG